MSVWWAKVWSPRSSASSRSSWPRATARGGHQRGRHRLARRPAARQVPAIALTVALFALATWRVLCAIMGDPVEGSEPKDRLKYAFLGVHVRDARDHLPALTIANWTEDEGASGSSGGSGNESSQEAASTIFDWPAGRWLVSLLGIGLIGYGLYHLYKEVVKKEFAERLAVDDSHWMIKLGRVGYSAQGLIYIVLGYFFIQAAMTFDPDEAKGPSGALQELASYTWGKWLLWIIAIGLFLYGIFCICEAKFRKSACDSQDPAVVRSVWHAGRTRVRGKG